jgi:hypothetical protein
MLARFGFRDARVRSACASLGFVRAVPPELGFVLIPPRSGSFVDFRRPPGSGSFGFRRCSGSLDFDALGFVWTAHASSPIGFSPGDNACPSILAWLMDQARKRPRAERPGCSWYILDLWR